MPLTRLPDGTVTANGTTWTTKCVTWTGRTPYWETRLCLINDGKLVWYVLEREEMAEWQVELPAPYVDVIGGEHIWWTCRNCHSQSHHNYLSPARPVCHDCGAEYYWTDMLTDEMFKMLNLIREVRDAG